MLLGEVERWREHGFVVGFWKVSREQNTEADAAAKKAAETGTAEPEFRDVMIEGSETTAAGDQPLPHILALCFEYEDLFYTVHDGLVQQLSAKSRLQRATTPAAALDMLSLSPAPSVILVADAAMTRHNKICERVIDLLRKGATVVLAGCFSSMVSQGQFDRFFARVGLLWRRGSYYRVTTRLRRRAVGDRLAGRLPAAYSQKAVFVKRVDKSAVWYAEKETGNEAAVVFAKVGKGMLGYVGDVNGEEGSKAVVLAMCGLLD
jgi:hypothetical protein